MAAHAAASVGLGEIGGVGMDVEYHAGTVVSDGGVWMGGKVLVSMRVIFLLMFFWWLWTAW